MYKHIHDDIVVFISVYFHIHDDNIFHLYGYIAMHTNMHGNIMYHLSDITVYICIHGDKTILSFLSPCISLYTTILDTQSRKSQRQPFC